MSHLWTGQPAPAEYVEYVLCQRFHKLPSEVRREPLPNILVVLECMAAEAKVDKMRRKAKK